MKNIVLMLIQAIACLTCCAQNDGLTNQQRKDITAVIDQYAKAREERDTTLLKHILTEDIDQLVSNGEWRNGLGSAVEGMLKSSAATPGTRTLTVNKIRLVSAVTSIVDCKYVIQNEDGAARNMWSTFILVLTNKNWKICAIRNMLPVK